jgi:hypothetical protein
LAKSGVIHRGAGRVYNRDRDFLSPSKDPGTFK